jgi:hypothetical protein
MIAFKLKKGFELGYVVKLARKSTSADARSVFDRIRHEMTNYNDAWKQAAAANQKRAFFNQSADTFAAYAPNNAAWQAEVNSFRAEHQRIF